MATTSPVQASQPDNNQVDEASEKVVIGYVSKAAECAVCRTHQKLCSVLDRFKNEIKDEMQEGLEEVKSELENTMQLMSTCCHNEIQVLKDELKKDQDMSENNIADLQENVRRRNSDIADLQENVRRRNSDIADLQECVKAFVTKKQQDENLMKFRDELQALKEELLDNQQTFEKRRDSEIADLKECVNTLLTKKQEEEKLNQTATTQDDLEASQEMEERKQKRRSAHLDQDSLEKMKQVVKNSPFHVERYDTGISMSSAASLEGATIIDQ